MFGPKTWITKKPFGYRFDENVFNMLKNKTFLNTIWLKFLYKVFETNQLCVTPFILTFIVL